MRGILRKIKVDDPEARSRPDPASRSGQYKNRFEGPEAAEDASLKAREEPPMITT